MADEQLQQPDNGPAQIDRSDTPYPNATRIEDGIAYDVSGKALGPVDVSKQPAQDTFNYGFKPNQDNFDYGFKQGQPNSGQPTIGPQQQPDRSQMGFVEKVERTFNRNLSMGAGETPLEVYDAAKNFINAPVEERQALVPNLMKAAWASQQRETQTGIEQMKQPGLFTKAGGVVRYIQGGIPLIGPMLGSIEDHLDRGEYAEATGDALTMLIPKVAEHFGPGVAASLDNAVNGSKNAQTALDARTTEAKVASENASKAVDQANQARQAHAAGQITDQERIQTEERASQAIANASKAQDAVKQAQEAKVNAGLNFRRVSRNIQSQAVKTVDQKAMDNANQVKSDFKRIVPQAKEGPGAYTDRDLDVTLRYLEDHHANVEEIRSRKDLYNALDQVQKGMEDQVQPYVEKYADENNPSDVLRDVRDKMSDSPREDFIERGMNALSQYNLDNPTIAESDSIRADLNALNRTTLNSNHWKVVDALKASPEFAARYYAAESLRNGEYDLFENKGVQGVREMRQDEASIIRVRNASENGINKGDVKLRGSGESNYLKNIAARSAPAVGGAAGALGGGALLSPFGPGGTIVGGIAGREVGHDLGAMLGKKILPGDLTHDEMVQRIMKNNKGVGAPMTQIVGEGLPATLSPRESALGPRDMRNIMRESSPLHSELASHYGMSVDNETYGNLEQRFMDDVDDKQLHGVALEPQERQLLNKINATNAADNLKAREDALQAQFDKPIGKYNLPDRIEPILHPNQPLKNGLTMEEGLTHDLAHVVVGNEMGLNFEDGIRSHLHPENQGTGRVMTAPIDWSKFVDDEGNVDFNKLSGRISDIAATFVAGGVANDLYHDVPFTENKGLGADISVLRSYLKATGMNDREVSEAVAHAADRAAEVLSRPGMREILEGHATLREGGLSDKYHFSPERIEQVLQDVKEGTKREITTSQHRGLSGERGAAGEELGAGAEGKNKEDNNKNVSEKRQGPSKRQEEGVGSRSTGSSAAGSEGASVAKPEQPALSAGLTLEHRDTGTMGEVTMNSARGAEGYLAYSKSGDNAYVASSLVDEAYKGQGNGREMYEKAADELRKQGVKTFSSDEAGSTSPEAMRVWESLMKRHPDEITRTGDKLGPKYTWKLNPDEEGEQFRNAVAPKNPALSEFTPSKNVPERTTGVPEADEAIRQGGGIPGGTMGRLEEPNHVKMFHDPENGTTLGFGPNEPVTAEAVRQKLAENRRAYTEGEARKTTGVGDPKVERGADDFNKQNGRPPVNTKTTPHDVEFAKRVADAYDQMKHEPNNPQVKAAYDAMKNDVDKQWDFATQKMGMKFEPWTKEGQPYANSKEMVADVKNNKHLYFFQGGESPTDNPLQAIDPKTGLSYNDKFRAVHDLFGHAAQGNQFGPKGEEVAYQLHRQMFSPEAVPALTTETRGQNSWVNFGQHLRNEAGNVPVKGEPGFVPQTERPYAEQKTALLPQEFHAAEPTGVKPQNPALSEGTTSDKLVKKYGTTSDPSKAGFILNDGKMVPLNGEHDQMLSAVQGPQREDFINSDKAVRTRFRTGRGGQEVVYSVPKSGVTPEQVQAIKKGVGQVGRYGNVVMETAGQDVNDIKTQRKEFPRVLDVDPMLRDLGVHPDQKQGDRISTRVPQGKNATENPLQGEPLTIGREAIDKSPEKLQTKFAGKVQAIPGVKIPKNITDSGKIIDRFTRHVADNLKWLHDQVPEEQRAANGKWYDSANKLAKDTADQHGFTAPQTAGVIAAMSPQMDWDMNVSLAKRITDIYKNHMDETVTPDMISKARDIISESRKGKNKTANTNLEQMLGNIEGKKIGDLQGLERAAAVRLYDETVNSKQFNRIDPATGNEMEPRTNNDGTPANLAWGNLSNAAKALSILDNGSRENISQQVGDSHKVRNFYNNIIDPSNDQDVTIDTHAVGAALLHPVGGNAKVVLDNFGAGGKNLGTGIKGTYPMYAEGYRLAAKELGLKPRELQSIIWEKVRDMFPAEWKTPENLATVEKEWKKYSNGNQTADKTRQNIMAMANEARQQVEAARATATEKARQRAEQEAQNPLAGKTISALDFLKAFSDHKAGANALAGGTK